MILIYHYYFFSPVRAFSLARSLWHNKAKLSTDTYHFQLYWVCASAFYNVCLKSDCMEYIGFLKHLQPNSHNDVPRLVTLYTGSPWFKTITEFLLLSEVIK